jgi:membrane protein implicated in regulation of membrane protease activity
MTSRKIFLLIAAVIFLLLGLAGFYRLMVGFPLSIAGAHLGQTTSFFIFVICVVLSLILFGEARSGGRGRDQY